MFGPLRVLGTIASEVIDALGMISTPIAEEIRDRDYRRAQAVADSTRLVALDQHLREVNEHLGAIRAVLEDVRNTQQHFADALTPQLVKDAEASAYSWAGPPLPGNFGPYNIPDPFASPAMRAQTARPNDAAESPSGPELRAHSPEGRPSTCNCSKTFRPGIHRSSCPNK